MLIDMDDEGACTSPTPIASKADVQRQLAERPHKFSGGWRTGSRRSGGSGVGGMIQPAAALGRAAGGGGDGGWALRFRTSLESGLRPARPRARASAS